MLPLSLQFLISMIAHAINERMARRVEYLQEEVRVLKELLAAEPGRTRVAFTPDQRRRLAIKGKALTPEERRDCCQIVRPETILAWFRNLAAKKYDSSDRRRTPGRPRKADDIRDLVIKLAAENPGWGYTKIRDALQGFWKAVVGCLPVDRRSHVTLLVPSWWRLAAGARSLDWGGRERFRTNQRKPKAEFSCAHALLVPLSRMLR